MVGLGTWQYNDTHTYEACKLALKVGYTHIDTAYVYGNSKGVGKCLKEHFDAGNPRSSVFVTTKVMATPDTGNRTMADLTLENLNDMQLDHVDLLLLHFPCLPGATGCSGSKTFRQTQWKSVEGMVALGKARTIGVSHYCPRHLEDIFEIMTIKPAVNQVQYHVGMGRAGVNATDDKDFTEKHGILYQSFSPLCGPCGKEGHMELINGPLVSGIGKNHNKTGSQVALRWQVQQGIPVIPKSDTLKHQSQNFDLFGWELTEDEMMALTNAKTPSVGGGPSPDDSGDCHYS